MNSTEPSVGGGGGAGGAGGAGGGGAAASGAGGRGAAVGFPFSFGPRVTIAGGLWRRFAGFLAVSALADDTRATLAGGIEGLAARILGSPMSSASGSGGGGRSSAGRACRANRATTPAPIHLASVDHRIRTVPI